MDVQEIFEGMGKALGGSSCGASMPCGMRKYALGISIFDLAAREGIRVGCGMMTAKLKLILRYFLLRCFAPLGLALLGVALTYSPTLSSAKDDLPKPKEITAAMRQAAEFYATKLASHGGYAREWTLSPFMGFVEGRESPTIISIQPYGTTSIGLSFVKAWQATGDELYRDAARAAAQSLIDCQLESGGWTDDFDFDGTDPKRYRTRKKLERRNRSSEHQLRNYTTLDDDKTQSAMLFLLELSHDPAFREDADLQEAKKYAFDTLLAAQEKVGAWPQQYMGPADPKAPVKKASFPEKWSRDFPELDYRGYYTLNDNNLLQVVNLLLRAYQLEGDARYMDAVKRCGDFLLLAQFEGDQAAWAQQYDREMQPTWARKFEPPALTSSESLGACQTLYEIWLATGVEEYREAILRALDWLDRSRLPDGSWARFYELRTNKPLYFTADDYILTYDDSNTPTHYAFKINWLDRQIRRMRENLTRKREELQEERKAPDSRKAWEKKASSLRSKVATALESRNADGVWEKNGKIDAGLFSQHFDVMTSYVEARKNG